MGKFSISLYMFFSFCRATAASSSLVGTRGGRLMTGCFDWEMIGKFGGCSNQTRWQMSVYGSMLGMITLIHGCDSVQSSVIYGNPPRFLCLFTFSTWPKVWRLFPEVRLPDGGGPHSRQNKQGLSAGVKRSAAQPVFIIRGMAFLSPNSPQRHQLLSDKGPQLSPGL